jgi:O-acetyl-ADP-ribose deacetylase (regulator of RNase III)
VIDQKERRNYLIQKLLGEQPRYKGMAVPQDKMEQKRLLRSLFNVRMPKEMDREFLSIQDKYLQEEIAEKGITDLKGLEPVSEGIYLWQGDITTLCCDAIVNAANSKMTGCYVPCHKCIDNCIHTFAGVQLRLECARQMGKQGKEEETGKAKITSAYNLPCRYVLHTVGPIISGKVTQRDRELLASCYRSCLELARQWGVKSIAFCCISTGEFHFPNDKAAEIAVQTVRWYREQEKSDMEVVFNVFREIDYQIYRKLLRAD